MLPKSADVTGGIPDRSLKAYGNIDHADCVVAAYFHIEQFKNVAKGSSFKKLIWRAGFHVPTNTDALDQYVAYLTYIGDKPTANVGVSVAGFLNWQEHSLGNVAAWSQIDTWSPGAEDRLHQAMIDFRGVILAGDLTLNAVNTRKMWTTGTSAADQPNANFGHAVALCRYVTGQFDEVVTWGYRQRMTPQFSRFAFDGAFVFLLESERNDPSFAKNLATIQSWTGVQQG